MGILDSVADLASTAASGVGSVGSAAFDFASDKISAAGGAIASTAEGVVDDVRSGASAIVTGAGSVAANAKRFAQGIGSQFEGLIGEGLKTAQEVLEDPERVVEAVIGEARSRVMGPFETAKSTLHGIEDSAEEEIREVAQTAATFGGSIIRTLTANLANTVETELSRAYLQVQTITLRAQIALLRARQLVGPAAGLAIAIATQGLVIARGRAIALVQNAAAALTRRVNALAGNILSRATSISAEINLRVGRIAQRVTSISATAVNVVKTAIDVSTGMIHRIVNLIGSLLPSGILARANAAIQAIDAFAGEIRAGAIAIGERIRQFAATVTGAVSMVTGNLLGLLTIADVLAADFIRSEINALEQFGEQQINNLFVRLVIRVQERISAFSRRVSDGLVVAFARLSAFRVQIAFPAIQLIIDVGRIIRGIGGIGAGFFQRGAEGLGDLAGQAVNPHGRHEAVEGPIHRAVEGARRSVAERRKGSGAGIGSVVGGITSLVSGAANLATRIVEGVTRLVTPDSKPLPAISFPSLGRNPFDGLLERGILGGVGTAIGGALGGIVGSVTQGLGALFGGLGASPLIGLGAGGAGGGIFGGVFGGLRPAPIAPKGSHGDSGFDPIGSVQKALTGGIPIPAVAKALATAGKGVASVAGGLVSVLGQALPDPLHGGFGGAIKGAATGIGSGLGHLKGAAEGQLHGMLEGAKGLAGVGAMSPVAQGLAGIGRSFGSGPLGIIPKTVFGGLAGIGQGLGTLAGGLGGGGIVGGLAGGIGQGLGGLLGKGSKPGLPGAVPMPIPIPFPNIGSLPIPSSPLPSIVKSIGGGIGSGIDSAKKALGPIGGVLPGMNPFSHGGLVGGLIGGVGKAVGGGLIPPGIIPKGFGTSNPFAGLGGGGIAGGFGGFPGIGSLLPSLPQIPGLPHLPVPGNPFGPMAPISNPVPSIAPLITSPLKELGNLAGGVLGALPMAPWLPPSTLPSPAPSWNPLALQFKGGGIQNDIDAGALRESLREGGSPGMPLSTDSAQGFREQALGEVGHARVHTDPTAAAAARSLGARAFTIGQDVFFGQGAYEPHTREGQALLGHELTHVVQQTGGKHESASLYTRAGGDALEQEAQQVERQLLFNYGRREELRVDSYLRTYDADRLTQREQERLDTLSLRSVDEAGHRIRLKHLAPGTINDLSINLDIDLGRMEDGEIIDIWASALVTAIQESLRSRIAESFTTVQRAFDDVEFASEYDEVPAPPPAYLTEPYEPEFPPGLSDYGKMVFRRMNGYGEIIGALEYQDKRMENAKKDDTRYYHEGELNEMFKTLRMESDAQPGSVAYGLQVWGFDSIAQFQGFEEEFADIFADQAVLVTGQMLQESDRVTRAERERYFNEKGATADLHELKKAVAILRFFQETLISVFLRPFIEEFRMGITTAQLNDQTIKLALKFYQEELKIGTFGLPEYYAAYKQARDYYAAIFPILGSDDILELDVSNLADDVLKSKFEEESNNILKNIRETADGLTPSRIWSLPHVITRTKDFLGMEDSNMATKLLTRYQKEREENNSWRDKAMMALVIGLTVLSVATAGATAPLAVAAGTVAGLTATTIGAVQAYDQYKDYKFGHAASQTAYARANAICEDDPSFFWLAVTIAMTILDMGAAIKSFKSAVVVLRDGAEITKLRQTAAEIYDQAEREAAAEGRSLEHSKPAFIESVVEAKKAADATASVRGKIAGELLGGTSQRVELILNKDKEAMKALILEHGDWSELMTALETGKGVDHTSAEVVANLREYRQKYLAEAKQLEAARAGELAVARTPEEERLLKIMEDGTDLASAQVSAARTSIPKDTIDQIRSSSWDAKINQARLSPESLPKAQQDLLESARRQIIEESMPNIEGVEAKNLGSPGFFSDNDITFVPSKAPTTPEEAAEAIRKCQEATDKFMEDMRGRLGGADPEFHLKTNAKAYQGQDLKLPDGMKPSIRAQAELAEDAGGFAAMARAKAASGDPQAWAEFRKRAEAAMEKLKPKGDVGEAELRHFENMQSALTEQLTVGEYLANSSASLVEQEAGRLRALGRPEGSIAFEARQNVSKGLLTDLADELAKGSNANWRKVRELQAQANLIDPEAYVTNQAFERIVEGDQAVKGDPGKYIVPKNAPLDAAGKAKTTAKLPTDPRSVSNTSLDNLGQFIPHVSHAPQDVGEAFSQLDNLVKYTSRVAEKGVKIPHLDQALVMFRKFPDINKYNDALRRMVESRFGGSFTPTLAGRYIEEQIKILEDFAIQQRVRGITAM